MTGPTKRKVARRISGHAAGPTVRPWVDHGRKYLGMVMQPGAAAGRLEPWRLAVGQLSQEQIVAALTVVLLLGFSLGLPGFATTANFLDLLRSISKLGILGLGMGLIVISRGIDLSEVAMMAGSWCVALTAIPRGLPPFWAAVLALTICVAVGLFNGVMVAFVEAPALFVTLATAYVIYGAAFWFASAFVAYAPLDAPGWCSPGAARCSAYRCLSSSSPRPRWSCTPSCRGPRSAASSMRRATIPRRRALRAWRYARLRFWNMCWSRLSPGSPGSSGLARLAVCRWRSCREPRSST